ncbi:protein PhnO (plasmid) [Arthrobacter sp. Hiyo8]|uniref:GNAT family N-acetyltransferase n=1 Tax=Arthrobacter sp. Hiyo1 TaxID=1588020 RepID=UPI0006839BCF|nr:GNAT family N-acetyltransferase [Arthrobacter sp. Hiyo1]BAS18559.1 protein PhnO [Arthrobacter sp. Hiyo8]GAP60715.1 protein PhnO [Arthrobacter sp. Hiyo1]
MYLQQLPGGATVRLARADDLPRIIELLESDALGPAESLPGATEESYLRAFEAITGEPCNELWVATDENGDVIGTLQLVFFTTLSWNAALRAQLSGVRIAASQRGRGTGSELVRWAVERARSKGCRVVQLSSDKRRVDAHRFYARLGFTLSHEGLRLVLP